MVNVEDGPEAATSGRHSHRGTPSPAILCVSGAGALGVEGAEPLVPSRGHATPTKAETSQWSMFLQLFGRNRDAAPLSQRDWDRFILERRAGRIDPSGRPVSDRTVEYDLKFLIAVLNWGAKSRDERGTRHACGGELGHRTADLTFAPLGDPDYGRARSNQVETTRNLSDLLSQQARTEPPSRLALS